MESDDLLARLKQEFDQGFVQARRDGDFESEDLLLVRLGIAPFALKMSEITGLVVNKAITPVPGPVREFLGVASFRGSLVPVYDLAAWMGIAGGCCSWWVLTGTGDERLALAFDEMEGLLRMHQSCGSSCERFPFVQAVLPEAQGSRPVLDLGLLRASILERLQGLAGGAGR